MVDGVVVGRLRGVVIWALALACLVLAVFAWVGSLGATTVFAPAAQRVSPAGIGLVGMTATTFALVGGLIAVRTRHNVVGGLLLGIGGWISITLAGMTAVALDLPGGQWMECADQLRLGVSPDCVPAAALSGRAPDSVVDGGRLCGSPMSRWSQPIIGVFATAYVADDVYAYDNPLLVRALSGSVLDNSLLAFVLFPCALVLGTASFIVRFRAARDVERAQVKWFAFAAVIVLAGYLFQMATWLLTGALDVDVAGLGLVVLTLSFNAVPIACGFAILRYRLYDIDRVVSRSVAYVLVTGVVLAVYALVIAVTTTFLSADPTWSWRVPRSWPRGLERPGDGSRRSWTDGSTGLTTTR